MDQQNKRIFKCVLIFFAAVIVLADVCLIMMHDKTFSENENRTLAQFPKFSVTSLTSGKFMTDAESFVDDQFFLRDNWISLKFLSDKYSGHENFNGVWLACGNYLFENPTTPSSLFKDNVKAIEKFAEKNTSYNIYMTLVPNAISILDFMRPFYFPIHDQLTDISYAQKVLEKSISFVNISDVLKTHKYENIYYKSDHHWTSLGAKYAFDSLAKVMGLENVINDYDVLRATDEFSGTMAATSGNFKVKDNIDLYVPKTKDFEYVVEYTDSHQKSATIYSSAALDTKNKYDVFLGGNHPLINIKTTNNNDKSLVIFKDSFANAFIQFILPYYETITIIDARYFSDDCNKIIENAETTDILFLYGVNTFVSDNYLSSVLLDSGK